LFLHHKTTAMTNLTLFSQIIQIIPRSIFNRLVRQLETDKHSKGINSWNQLISMLFCHFGKVNSLRDISNGMRAARGNLNHLGLERAASKSSLAYLNEKRDWRLFQQLYFELLSYFHSVHHFQRKGLFKLKRKIFIIDSTTIPLCLKVFNWAKFRKRKGAVKVHTVLDYDGCLPAYLLVTDGKTHDVTAAKQINLPSDSVAVIDKAYVDYSWLHVLDSTGVFFVTRAKDNMQYDIVEHYQITAKDADTILQDVDIVLSNKASYNKYPQKLRLVKVWDQENQRELIFLTNNRSWTAKTISQLYKARWEIEIFFKQIKQHLKIKSFVGTSENAVMIQIWTAMITILLLSYLKEKAKFGWQLSNLITFLRLNLFVKINLWDWINKPFDKPPEPVQLNYKLDL